MTGEKHRSRNRKKRKGKGFLGIPPHAKSVEESVLKDDEIARSKNREHLGSSHSMQVAAQAAQARDVTLAFERLQRDLQGFVRELYTDLL